MRYNAKSVAAMLLMALLLIGVYRGAYAEATVVKIGIVQWTIPTGWRSLAVKSIEGGEIFISLKMEGEPVTAALYGIPWETGPESTEALRKWLVGAFYQGRMKAYAEGFKPRKKNKSEYTVPIASGQDAIVVEYQLRINRNRRKIALVGLNHGNMWIGIFVGTSDQRAEVTEPIKRLLGGLSITDN